MQADEGKRVKISFICRLEDGTIYDFADRDTLEFVIGDGNTLPTLEMGVLGMSPGETRTIRVPAEEANDFQYMPEEAPGEAGFPAGVGGAGYEFGPGDNGDVAMPAVPEVTAMVKRPSAASDLFFDVEMLAVEDAEVDLQE